MNKGYLCLVLHAHLPFIRYPEYENFMEENWLFEGIIETYIPLLLNFQRLAEKEIEYKITMSLSPTLCEMLADDVLQERFLDRLISLIELSEKELKRTKNTEFYNIALMYNRFLIDCRDAFVNDYDMNILNGFKYFQDCDKLEIITCSASHGFLPLLNENENVINAQIEIAVNNYYKFFNRTPRGIWNSECAYYPGMEKILKKWGIKYFFVDTHGILHSENRPKYGIFAPVLCENGVAAFARDVESSKEVWSATEGYPGDPYYREFYRDIGFDLPLEYIGEYLHSDNIRMMTGFKYYRITGSENKCPYDIQLANEKVIYHAKDFVQKRELQVEKITEVIDRKPVIISPYDAELFGHWWFEGPDFMYNLCKEINNSENLSMVTPIDYLKEYPDNQVSTPSLSTWGNKGFNYVWLNESNDWIYRHLHECADRMVEFANKYRESENKLTIRILNQMSRELLIAQTSCWAFIISSGTTVEFATKKIKTHIGRFLFLYDMLDKNDFNEEYLDECEWRDSIFPEIDFKAFADN